MRRSTKAAALIGLAWGAGLAGCDRAERGDDAPDSVARDTAAQLDPRILATLPPGATPDEALNGRDLFVVNCAACHGASGEGTALGPSLVDDEWIHTTRELEQIAALVRTGVAEPQNYPVPMPPRGAELNEAELRSLAAYVYALRGLQQ